MDASKELKKCKYKRILRTERKYKKDLCDITTTKQIIDDLLDPGMTDRPITHSKLPR
jgi:hypothetical protein